ncbi:glycoside hydrolase [Heliobacterium chlorum]|uniref:Glycoside hydrolase n=1 Tax=Heliobacterium chlorum TaxID=2698 RepID=A0ABR7T0B3_HELCL|nr:glycoside hydrolase [Heliobacterium chlorum]
MKRKLPLVMLSLLLLLFMHPTSSWAYFFDVSQALGIYNTDNHQLQEYRNDKVILGYYPVYYDGDKAAYNSLAMYGDSFNAISTFTYSVDKQGNLSGTAPTDGLALAKARGVKTYVLIHNLDENGNFDQQLASTFLGSSQARKNAIDQLMSMLQSNGYDGVTVDIESVKASERANYSQFIEELKNALSPRGYKVIVSVPAKLFDDRTSAWGGAFDYTALANSADYLQIMTYDEHWPGGQAGPIASIDYVNRAIRYTLTAVPKEKVLLGIATYGYDWTGKTTKAVDYYSVPQILSTFGITPWWDESSKTPWFTYWDGSGQKHEVWYENARSTGYKLDLVNQYDLAGVAIWRLGFEDKSFWDIVDTKLK